jgi:hypothetical protein
MQDNLHPMTNFLNEWAPDLQDLVAITPYESLSDIERLPDGAYIFADVDRLPGSLGPAAIKVWETLSARGRSILLNRPGHSLSRRHLLTRLHATGRNQFRVGGVEEPVASWRFPVFIRHSTEHAGSLTGLIATPQDLTAEIARLIDAGHDPTTLLVVEFADVSDDGLFRKYAAFRIGDTILAHHVMIAQSWEVKGPSLVSAQFVDEERAFQRSNPHEADVRAAFDLGGIQFGRMDYGLVDGKVQVWEINTNPTFLYPPDRYDAIQIPSKTWFNTEVHRLLRQLAQAERGKAAALTRWARRLFARR